MSALSGVLLLDKPPGPTSHDMVRHIRKAAGIRKVGHAGTLDPFASGLLLILVGSSTRLSQYLMGLEKEYRAGVLLGRETDTHDLEGEVVAETSAWEKLTRSDLEDAVQSFQGTTSQIPPRFSAKKVQGEPAHRRARRGEAVDLSPAEVTVYEMELEEVNLPRISLRIRCSSGTYVRALARDLGRSLGVGGHLTELRRTAVGSFRVASGLAPDELRGAGDLRDHLLSPSLALGHLPFYEVGAQEASRLRQGRFLELPAHLPRERVPEGSPIRVVRDGCLVAIASRVGEELRPRKVLTSS